MGIWLLSYTEWGRKAVPDLSWRHAEEWSPRAALRTSLPQRGKNTTVFFSSFITVSFHLFPACHISKPRCMTSAAFPYLHGMAWYENNLNENVLCGCMKHTWGQTMWTHCFPMSSFGVEGSAQVRSESAPQEQWGRSLSDAQTSRGEEEVCRWTHLEWKWATHTPATLPEETSLISISKWSDWWKKKIQLRCDKCINERALTVPYLLLLNCKRVLSLPASNGCFM